MIHLVFGFSTPAACCDRQRYVAFLLKLMQRCSWGRGGWQYKWQLLVTKSWLYTPPSSLFTFVHFFNLRTVCTESVVLILNNDAKIVKVKMWKEGNSVPVDDPFKVEVIRSDNASGCMEIGDGVSWQTLLICIIWFERNRTFRTFRDEDTEDSFRGRRRGGDLPMTKRPRPKAYLAL